MPPRRSFQLYSIISHISKDNFPNFLTTIFERQIQSQLWPLVEKTHMLFLLPKYTLISTGKNNTFEFWKVTAED